MKKLTSKKGFTLIEMLVVIAIIAVLVAIIVPTVSSSTAKAKAATNAANLRTIQAEIGAALLSEDETWDESMIKTKNADGSATVEIGDTDISVPKYTGDKGGQFACTVANGSVTCKYGDYGVTEYAAAAGNS